MAYKNREDKLNYHKRYNKEYYKNNTQKEKDRVNKRKIETREWFKNFKKTLKCNRCSEDHPACLDFHHIDGDKKEFQIPRMVKNGFSIDKILEEIEKCEILCSNCPRKEHFEKNYFG